MTPQHRHRFLARHGTVLIELAYRTPRRSRRQRLRRALTGRTDPHPAAVVDADAFDRAVGLLAAGDLPAAAGAFDALGYHVDAWPAAA
ncbi:hypothetical protein V6N00_13595 [Tersicoccus sp. MR15.9]|uniref:hypothetical protein n=1 Tax=Tersicoccus mangrovi TaxID=3121635 RepID=UPI002FE69B7D